MKVIGTAGHIDHGKSTLVKRLTGIDPDRLEEEKRRGMTVDLGFAWLDLPSGTRVSIVDVPGHERFVHNMLAGVGGIDLALIVVAADESVMPQTREHAAILDLLGVDRAVVVITKADVVEDALLELVAEDARQLLQPTRLAGAPVVAVDGVSGRGVDTLLATLDRSLANVPPRIDSGASYLPIDRAFTRAGFGTIVTGTLHAGSLAAGDDVDILPSGKRARIRGLHIHGSSVETAPPGARVAVNLAAVSVQELRRGDAISRGGALRTVQRFDARMRVLPASPISLRSGLSVRVHVGAAEVGARLRCLNPSVAEPGVEAWIRVVLDVPVAARRGQTFVVRLPSPLGTVGGGEIVDLSPRRGPRGEVTSRLERLGADRLADVALAGLGSRPWSAAGLSAQLGESTTRVKGALNALAALGKAIEIGDSYIAAAAWEDVCGRVREGVDTYHRQHPLRIGIPKEELRRVARWPTETWADAVRVLVRTGVVVERAGVVALPNHAMPASGSAGDRIRALLTAEPFCPPDGPELIRRAGGDRELLSLLVRDGSAVRVSDDLYFSRRAYEEAVGRVAAILAVEGSVTVARVRDELGTSRRYALALLEYLDRQRMTRREGDVRVAGSREIPCA